MFIGMMSDTVEMTSFVSRNLFFRFIIASSIEIYFWSYLIVAAIGGLLGLGFGFSFISAMELVYFFTVRMYFTKKDEATNVIHPENHQAVKQISTSGGAPANKMGFKDREIKANGLRRKRENPGTY